MQTSEMYYIVVVEELSTATVVATSTLLVEHKFIHCAANRARIEDVVVSPYHQVCHIRGHIRGHIRSQICSHIHSHICSQICIHIRSQICSHIHSQIRSHMRSHIRSHTHTTQSLISYECIIYCQLLPRPISNPSEAADSR